MPDSRISRANCAPFRRSNAVGFGMFLAKLIRAHALEPVLCLGFGQPCARRFQVNQGCCGAHAPGFAGWDASRGVQAVSGGASRWRHTAAQARWVDKVMLGFVASGA